MTPERQRELASMGGKTAHARGKAHQFTPAQAKAAGTLGGLAVSRDRDHMAQIGRIGGSRRAVNKKEKDARVFQEPAVET